MRQSQLFTKTNKEISKEETSLNAQALIRAGFVDKLGAGIYTFLPLGLRVLNKITSIVKEEMNSLGGQEVLMPALTPKSFWDATNRWDDIDVLFKLSGSDSREYALGATHEEIVTPLAQKFCSSYKQLPFAIYQIQTKFRNEKRAKAGLMRGREFLMKDLYSFHASQEDLEEYYEKVQEAYLNIYAKVGLGDVTYLTSASGGDFSKYSHEFQTLSEAGEDLIYICDKCRIAINEEIIEEQSVCPKCQSSELREAKSIEVGNIFKLGTRFSNAFNFKYLDKEGLSKEVVMGAYGIGISRLMASIVEVHNDEKGIIWPKNVAPFEIHLISFKEDQEADKIYKELTDSGFEALYDDRDLSLGQKLNDADLIGCPFRLLVSEKSLKTGELELKKRGESDVEMIKREELINYLKNIC